MDSRAAKRCCTQFADEFVCDARRCDSCRTLQRSDQKFTEPVALSSTSPENLRLPPTALRSGFGLLALRARCKGEANGARRWIQGPRNGAARNLRMNSFATPAAAIRAARSKGRTKSSPSRWRFRPPLPRTFGFRLLPSGAASVYSRSVLGARGKLTGLADGFKGRETVLHAICG